MQLSVVWTFPLYRCKGRRPAQSFARPTNVGLKLIQDTMGIFYSKSRFRLHQPDQQVADIQNAQQLNRKPKAVSTSHACRLKRLSTRSRPFAASQHSWICVSVGMHFVPGSGIRPSMDWCPEFAKAVDSTGYQVASHDRSNAHLRRKWRSNQIWNLWSRSFFRSSAEPS